jgi:hypothetical protein
LRKVWEHIARYNIESVCEAARIPGQFATDGESAVAVVALRSLRRPNARF